MKLTHKQKVRKANQLMSQMEKSQHFFFEGTWHRKPKTPLFQSRKWSEMKQAKAIKEHTKRQYSKKAMSEGTMVSTISDEVPMTYEEVGIKHE